MRYSLPISDHFGDKCHVRGMSKVNSCLNLYRHSTSSASEIWESLSRTREEPRSIGMLSMNKMKLLNKISLNSAVNDKSESFPFLDMNSGQLLFKFNT